MFWLSVEKEAIKSFTIKSLNFFVWQPWVRLPFCFTSLHPRFSGKGIESWDCSCSTNEKKKVKKRGTQIHPKLDCPLRLSFRFFLVFRNVFLVSWVLQYKKRKFLSRTLIRTGQWCFLYYFGIGGKGLKIAIGLKHWFTIECFSNEKLCLIVLNWITSCPQI